MSERVLKFLHYLPEKSYTAFFILFLLIAFAGWTIYSTVQTVREVNVPSVPDKNFVPPARPSQNFTEELQKVYVFGDPRGADLDAAYGMKLIGIFLNKQAKESRVLIALTGQAEKSYAIGETLSNGARVHEILKDSVVLVQDGKLVKLVFLLQGIQFNTLSPHAGLFSEEQKNIESSEVEKNEIS